MLSVVKNPQQTSFDWPTERPVAAFERGFVGSTINQIFEFTNSHFTLEHDSTTNIAPHIFVILDQRSVDYDGDDARTALVVQEEYGQLKSVRARFADVTMSLTGMASGGKFYISEWRNDGSIDDRGIFKTAA
jgi:hypothetical protein